MLLAGSDDGLYRIDGVTGDPDPTVEKTLDAGPVQRVRRFDGVPGVFAATRSGLFHSPAGGDWEDLGVPAEHVYAVGASPARDHLYAGTRPAAVYVADLGDLRDRNGDAQALDWRELDGFQDLPSRDGWRLPRHENLAQVRDLHVHPERPDRVVAGVEVGGVHVSEDGGETWTERRDEGEVGLHDDVHELSLAGPEEFVAATGFGLFRSTDAGRSWTRLDEGFDQRYFRSLLVHDGAIYAGSALAHTSTWVEDDAEPVLFAFREDEGLQPVEHPRPGETVTGLASVNGRLVASTHRGTLLASAGGTVQDWTVLARLPTADPPVSYTPLATPYH